MDDLPTPEQRRDMHRAWLAAFGFSDEDWRRMRLLAEEVTASYSPPALTDLSVPVGVAAVVAQDRYRGSSQHLGVITNRAGLKIALRFWRMDPHEKTGWTRRRGAKSNDVR